MCSKDTSLFIHSAEELKKWLWSRIISHPGIRACKQPLLLLSSSNLQTALPAILRNSMRHSYNVEGESFLSSREGLA